MRPDAGKAIGLQFQPHLQGVALLGTAAFLSCAHLRFDAQQILHVMTDLVRNHIGLCEITRGFKALGQFAIKAQIDIDAAVRRAIKRANFSAGRAAA